MKTFTVKLSLAAVCAITLASCASYKRIGDLTMISTRNVDSKTEYVEIKRYVEAKGKTLEGTVEDGVKTVNGGDYMKNVQIHYNGKKFKITGDVWGIAPIRTTGYVTPTAPQIIQASQPIGGTSPSAVAPQAVAAPVTQSLAVFATGEKVAFKRKLLDKNLTTAEIMGIDGSRAVLRYTYKGNEYTEKRALDELTKVQ